MRALAILAVLLAMPAQAQLADRYAARIPPNALDRAGARLDTQSTTLAARSATERQDAQADTRASAQGRGPASGSTMIDGPTGLGAGSTPLSAITPPR